MDSPLRKATPELWLALVCHWWGGSEALAEHSWQCVQWSQAPALNDFWRWIMRQLYVDVPDFTRHYTPQAVCFMLEMLVEEQRLGRAHATQLEEHLLTAVDATGQWHEVPRYR